MTEKRGREVPSLIGMEKETERYGIGEISKESRVSPNSHEQKCLCLFLNCS